MPDESPKTSALSTPISPSSSERFWSLAAHLSVFTPLIGILLSIAVPAVPLYVSGSAAVGPLLCIILYLSSKKRSSFIADHAIQALIFQVIYLTLWLLLVYIAGNNEFHILLCGIPLLYLSILPFVGGLQALRGIDFNYPIIRHWMGK
jgi:uncharacterized membrane protein